MAIGDVVSGIFTATGNYQPAGGVEVNITFLSPVPAGNNWYLYDGANSGIIEDGPQTIPQPVRLLITNTMYLQFVRGVAADGGYSGYQIK